MAGSEPKVREARPAGADAASSRPSARLVASLSLFVVVLAGVGYWQTGSPSLIRRQASAIDVAATAPQPAAEASAPGPALQQIESMVGKLAERMKANPDDAEGWIMLARSYAVLGRFDDALPAYARAAELQPGNASVLSDYAGAVAATQQTVNNPRSNALIERALKADAKHPKALALAGSAAFDRGEFAIAIAHWQKLVDQLPAGSDLAPRVQAMIGEARGKLVAAGAAPATSTSPPVPAPTTTTAAAQSPSSSATPAAGTSVSGTVTIDPALAAQASPDDSVFVFARAASGSRMPLAVQRAKVKDLPLAFRLDDSMAMAPGMNLSSATQLTVGARISKTGNAIAQPGDLAGEATGVAPGANNVAIRIATVVAKP